MKSYNIITLNAHPEWRIQAARWFHEKWKIPLEEYLISIDESIQQSAPVPQWYVVEKPRDFDPFGHAGLSPLATI